ncbi:RNA polymerase sigma factor, partial [Nocardioides pelophilus]|uniref:RNA polymerase sigma factor n=1 Tax=Nocardioides pelophilus TaxID=2172019 RepID=UPI0024838BB6
MLLWLESRASGLDDSPDDLASEAWLVAAQKIADFHGTSSDFAGWLFGIARNHAANARRRSGRRQAASAAIP